MAIPITCFDNFYSDPDKVRDWALSLEYRKDDTQSFPGERTELINVLDGNFFDKFCEKLFSIFYDFQTPVTWTCSTRFQKIYPFSENFNSPLNSGWIHVDDDSAFAGVIYLNKVSNPNAGTSIFYPKKDIDEEHDYHMREDFYSDKNPNKEEYIKKLNEHNNNFELSLDIKNTYNKLICYDSKTWHKESNFMVNENDASEFRLTQVFFITELCAHSFPKSMFKSFNL